MQSTPNLNHCAHASSCSLHILIFLLPCKYFLPKEQPNGTERCENPDPGRPTPAENLKITEKLLNAQELGFPTTEHHRTSSAVSSVENSRIDFSPKFYRINPASSIRQNPFVLLPRFEAKWRWSTGRWTKLRRIVQLGCKNSSGRRSVRSFQWHGFRR